jgi:hypothetical protein
VRLRRLNTRLTDTLASSAMFGEVLRTILAVLSLTAPTVPSTRDDTASLQAQLDAAQDITLPALADGSCYRTRGL